MKSKMKIPRYIGESGRSAFERGFEHLDQSRGLWVPVKVSELLLDVLLGLLHLLDHFVPKRLDLVADLVASVADGLQESVSWIGRRALRLVLAKVAWQEDCHEEQPGCHGSAFLDPHSKRMASNSCIVSPAQLKPF